LGQLGKTKDGFYPDLTLNEAVELVEKIDVVGGSISSTTLAKIVGIDPRGAGLRSRIDDLKAYGLVEENGGIKLSGLGRDVARGNTTKAWEAFLNIPLYSKLHDRLEGREVEADAFHQVLYEITRGELDAITRRQVRLKNNYMEALKFGVGSTILPISPNNPSYGPSSTPLEMMESDITLVDKGGKLFIVVEKSLDQVKLAQSFLGSVEESLKAKKQKITPKRAEASESSAQLTQ